ncbi:hypothetical protein UUU_35570 [Klebsiella pneumoniae subsp. pneumoniae DSM 30104 = JCM 1662 = NBRC 14940]|nr:hypothetical protein UUU_35570 [Klebsiella pneumoniae subsp. pneumoniae DSM 30104 = JCM 1662 = NBRC 14940]
MSFAILTKDITMLLMQLFLLRVTGPSNLLCIHFSSWHSIASPLHAGRHCFYVWHFSSWIIKQSSYYIINKTP